MSAGPGKSCPEPKTVTASAKSEEARRITGEPVQVAGKGGDQGMRVPEILTAPFPEILAGPNRL